MNKQKGKPTVQEAVVLEAPSAEKGVEGMHCLLLRNTLSTGTVNVGGALRR